MEAAWRLPTAEQQVVFARMRHDSIRFGLKKEGTSDTGHEAITLSEVKQSPKDKDSLLPPREVDKDRKYRGGCQGLGEGRACFTGTVPVLQDGRVAGTDGGLTLRMHSRPQNCTLEDSQGGEFYVSFTTIKPV